MEKQSQGGGAVHLAVKPMNMKTAAFKIVGTSPLVIHRFDEKIKRQFMDKIEKGSTPAGKKKHAAQNLDELFERAKYIGETGGKRWEGFNASALRCAMISACRLVNFKMTLAKLSIVIIEDGRDVADPSYALVRINGKAERFDAVARTETGVAMLTIRPRYFPWSATAKIKFDADQFALQDIANLLARVGVQVGIGEGRNDSKNSCGMGWGAFEVKG